MLRRAFGSVNSRMAHRTRVKPLVSEQALFFAEQGGKVFNPSSQNFRFVIRQAPFFEQLRAGEEILVHTFLVIIHEQTFSSMLLWTSVETREGSFFSPEMTVVHLSVP